MIELGIVWMFRAVVGCPAVVGGLNETPGLVFALLGHRGNEASAVV